MIDQLNILIRVLTTSLPAYLHDARPFAERDSEPLREVIRGIAEEEAVLALRVARAIRAESGSVTPVHFPIQFTSLHDLSPSYLAARIVERQENDLDRIQQCIDQLAPAPHLQALAKDVYRAVKQHKKSVEELLSTESNATS